MEEALRGIGLSVKEVKVYLTLLESGGQTVLSLAEAIGEKRPNTYALLDSLEEKGLVVGSSDGVKIFNVVNPAALQNLSQAQREHTKQAAVALQAVLPQIKSQYSLITDRPGVVHMAGVNGFLRLLDDMSRSKTEILLVASNDVPSVDSDLQAFRKRLLDRKAAGIQTRAIFHNADNAEQRRQEFTDRGMEVRFLGAKEFKGEFAIYEDNVVFTVYDPSLVVTVITNGYIAETMRTLFEQLWEKAE